MKMIRQVKHKEYIAIVYNNHLYIEAPLKDDPILEEARDFFDSSFLSDYTTVFYIRDMKCGGLYLMDKNPSFSAPYVLVSESLEKILNWALKRMTQHEGTAKKLTDEGIRNIESRLLEIASRKTNALKK